jgi:hypothetical protein
LDSLAIYPITSFCPSTCPTQTFRYSRLSAEPLRLAALAGKDALNCGRVTRSQRPDTASECASKALAGGKPFYVSYDQYAWGGGYTVGFARDINGNLSFVGYTNEGWPTQPPSKPGHVSDDNHVRFGACPKPQILFKLRNGELTCIGSTE